MTLNSCRHTIALHVADGCLDDGRRDGETAKDTFATPGFLRSPRGILSLSSCPSAFVPMAFALHHSVLVNARTGLFFLMNRFFRVNKPVCVRRSPWGAPLVSVARKGRSRWPRRTFSWDNVNFLTETCSVSLFLRTFVRH